VLLVLPKQKRLALLVNRPKLQNHIVDAYLVAEQQQVLPHMHAAQGIPLNCRCIAAKQLQYHSIANLNPCAAHLVLLVLPKRKRLALLGSTWGRVSFSSFSRPSMMPRPPANMTQ
jgi:hypothetical protein